MSALYNRIEMLCKGRGLNITDMCRASGASRGSLTDLKMGRIASLNSATLNKIANYFDVSIGDLLGTDTGSHTVTDAKDSVILQGSSNNSVSNGAPAVADDGLDAMELELIRIYRLLDARMKNKFMSYAFQLEDSLQTHRLDDLCADAQARTGAGSKRKGPAHDREL